MTDITQNDIEENEFEPKELAEILFSNLPQPINSISLLPQINNNDINNNDINNDYISYIFEILITIFMEGVMDSKRLLEMVIEKKYIDKIDNQYVNYYDINIDLLMFIEQWFKSFGFYISIREYDDISQINNNNRYCEILLKSNPLQKGLFIYKGINNEEYHFTLNSHYKSNDKLEKIYAKLEIPKYKDNPSKIYTISFKQINLNNNNSCK